jgi:hypothetical protein
MEAGISIMHVYPVKEGCKAPKDLGWNKTGRASGKTEVLKSPKQRRIGRDFG